MTTQQKLDIEASDFGRANHPKFVEVDFTCTTQHGYFFNSETGLFEVAGTVFNQEVYIETKNAVIFGNRVFVHRSDVDDSLAEFDIKAWQRAEREATEWCYETYYDD